MILNDSNGPNMKLPHGIYQHYKGQKYQVFGIVRHSETQEELVMYQCLYGDYSFWVRPLEMFQSYVTLDQGESVPRFKHIA